jgi:hypothetical protein
MCSLLFPFCGVEERGGGGKNLYNTSRQREEDEKE